VTESKDLILVTC